MRSEQMSPSLKQKFKSKLCISGCFRHNIHPGCHIDHHHDFPPSPSPVFFCDKTSNLASTPSPSPRDSTKTKSPRLSRTLSKSQDKCRSLIHRIGGGVASGGGVGGGASSGGGRHIRRHTTDFHYDPLSYSLNFDQGDDENLDQFPSRNFSSRLPHSPP